MYKTKLTFVALLLCLISGSVSAQIIGSDGFLMGEGLEVGIHNDGYEGSAGLPPFETHYRGWTGRLGFLANPQNDGWVNYDGDFFMPGAPQNCFGIEVDGVTYRNSSALGSTIPSDGLSSYYTVGRCKFITWSGSVGGIDIEMTYKMDSTEHYYTVLVNLTNTTALDKEDVFFYKSLDPDNNMDLGWGFATFNTVVDQPTPECPRALVTATDNNGWESYIGLGGLGEEMRVSYGGFYVEDASDIWFEAAPHEGTPGSTSFSDQAISICHRDELIPAGATSSFEFVVVMNGSQVNEAMLEGFFFTYEGGPDPTTTCNDTTGYIAGGGIIYETDGVVDTIRRCTIEPSVLWVEAPGEVISEYNLAWLDMDEGDTLGVEAYTTIIEGTDADTAHITCFLTFGDCFGGIGLANEYVVITIQSPEIYVPEPEIFCGDSVLITDIEVIDTAEVEDAITSYHGTYPENADDDSDLWPSDYMKEGDIVYVMVKNGETGCYDVDSIVVEFNIINAGEDGTGPDMCNTDASDINLNDYLTDADAGGVWEAVDPLAGAGLDAGTGMFTPYTVSPGVYEFLYIVGEEPCPTDTAVIEIEIFEQHTAGLDGSIETCSAPGVTVNLNDLLDGNDPGGAWVEITETGAFNTLTGILDVSDLELGTYIYNYISPTSGPCPADIAVFTVIVVEGPTAGFTFSPGSVYTDDTEVTFTNVSIGATAYEWNFGDDSPVSTEENPVHEYPTVAGIYEINLYVENDLGCADSITAYIKVKDVTLFYIPNSFTPDGNNTNDTFRPVFETGFDPYNFHLTIYNRYGEVVFESYDASAGWDGTYGTEGIIQSGIYTWSLEFKELDTDRVHQHKGHVTILK